MEKYLIFILLMPVIVILALIILVAIKISKNQISRKKIFKELGKDEVDNPLRLEFLKAFGGSDNIVSISREMSRITFKTIDVDLVDVDKVKELGATGILVAGSEVKCSFNDAAEEVFNLIK